MFRIEVPSSEALDARRLGADGHRARGDRRARAVRRRASRFPSANLQRVFAIVELLRAVAAFMIAPIFAHFAATVGGSLDDGTGIALWIGLGLALAGAAARRRDLRARRSAPADARPRALPRRRGAGLVLAAAAGAGPPANLSAARSPRPRAAAEMAEPSLPCPAGPVLFAYDGSELAELAIEEAGRQLAPGREALVVCVWQPADVGFLPTGDAAASTPPTPTEVRKAARGDRRARGGAGRAGRLPAAEHRGRGARRPGRGSSTPPRSTRRA